MSIATIRSLYETAIQGTFKLYGINHIVTDIEDRYECCDLESTPDTLLSDYFKRTCEGWLKNSLEKAEHVIDYVGEFSSSFIEKFPLDISPNSPAPAENETHVEYDSPIQEQVNKLYDGVRASADAYQAPDKAKTIKAFLIKCTYQNRNGHVDIAFFITVRSPFITMKHKWTYRDGSFQEDNSLCISLIEHFDLILTGNKCYVFSDKAEQFLSLERTYKRKCQDSIENIVQANLLSDSERFASFASCGYQPRKFLSFRPDLLQKMSGDTEYLHSVCRSFRINLTQSNEIDTTDDGNTAKFIKLICNRGKQDPLDSSACEVPSSIPWL